MKEFATCNHKIRYDYILHTGLLILFKKLLSLGCLPLKRDRETINKYD